MVVLLEVLLELLLMVVLLEVLLEVLLGVLMAGREVRAVALVRLLLALLALLAPAFEESVVLAVGRFLGLVSRQSPVRLEPVRRFEHGCHHSTSMQRTHSGRLVEQ